MIFHKLDPKDMAGKIPTVTRVLLWFFGWRFNFVASMILCRAHERGVIDSRQLHVLAQQFDPTQHGVIGIVAGK